MSIHYHHLRREKQKSPSKAGVIDMLVYVGGTVGVLVILPQLLKIWVDHETAGVSILSWSGMLLASTFWLGYGIVHKQKPIAYVNFLGASMQLIIVIGLIIFNK